MNAEFVHDLRLPLQLIQSGVQMARLAMEDPTLDAAEYLDMATENAALLRRMLDDALAASGRTAARRVDAVACLRALCRRCEGYARERGVALRFDANVDALWMVVDEDRLSRATLNLTMNALRFAPANGRVTVRLCATGDFAEISVEDDGPGIAPERLPYLFLRGETEGGDGYGLPAALDCARALGGTLRTEAGAVGGARFVLRVPVKGDGFGIWNLESG